MNPIERARLDVLLKEYEYLQTRDQDLTKFYQRFATVGIGIIGVVIYYAEKTTSLAYVIVPFLLIALMLFIEFWRFYTVLTNSCLNHIGDEINRIVGESVLVFNKANENVEKGKFLFHRGSGIKVPNPMFILIFFLVLPLLVFIVAFSWVKLYVYFRDPANWRGWKFILPGLFVIYLGLIMYVARVLAYNEHKKKLFEFGQKVIGWEMRQVKFGNQK